MILILVESPSKAKTIEQYVGKDFVVAASYGHIRALPSEDGSVIPEKDFEMHFKILDKSQKHFSNILQKYKGCQELLLATDQDREGEAISWHIVEALKETKAFKDSIPIKRIVFNEITKPAILAALKNPRNIDERLVAAQQARQALDYLVGFNLSPVLWKKLPGSRSAGRVQSVALKLISEREDEIETFKSEEYWSIEAEFLTEKHEKILAKLWSYEGEKLEKFSINTEQAASSIVSSLTGRNYKIGSIETKEIKKQPPPPFTTSTMLQEAARKLGFSAKKTSKLAQDLYEGIKIGGKIEGLITYMRTDSVNVSSLAIEDTRTLINSRFGNNYLPSQPRFFKNKAKNAQEAHEAIRPTQAALTPDKLKGSLEADHYKLYNLIWKRMMASQMSQAILDSVALNITDENDSSTFRASGSTIRFDGFLKLYTKDKAPNEEELLPRVTQGEKLDTQSIIPYQHFTEPPPRYTEASLVKRLEELGIGRPSTYPSIISVLQDREYVTIEQKRFFASPKGRIVNAFLVSFFEKYVEYGFTAGLEDQLDNISNGKAEHKKVLREFWVPFKSKVDEVLAVKMVEILERMETKLHHFLFGTDSHKCPVCDSGEMKLKTGKFGPFLGCSNYPNCKNIKQVLDHSSQKEAGPSSAEGDLPLPHQLGTDPDGYTYTIKRGPYGVYLEILKDDNIRRVKIPTNKPLKDIDLPYATTLTSLPRVLGESAEFGVIKAGFGRFGPYVEHGGQYASIRGKDPLLITLPEAEAAIKAKASQELGKGKSPRRKFSNPKKKTTSAKKATSKKKG